MGITRYEAATFYDSNRQQQTPPGAYLVLDLDNGSVGACSCEEGGSVKLTATWALPEETDLWMTWVNGVKALVSQEEHAVIEKELERQLPEVNRVLSNYFTSDRLLDSAALTVSGQTLTCSQVEASFAPVKELLRTLCQQGEGLVPGTEREEMRIFPLGQAAHCYLAEHTIRAFFSADPFLPDDRLVTDGFRQDSAQIIAQGTEYAKAKATVAHTVSLVLTRGTDGTTQELPLLTKGAPPTQVTPEAYIGPVYIAAGQPIVIQVDGVIRTVNLPYSVAPMDSDLIDLAAGGDGSGVTLSIRPSRTPTRVYGVQLV